MCGVVGVVSLKHKTIKTNNLVKMVNLLKHRGPDDAGYLFFHTGLHHSSKISFYQAFSDEKFKTLSPLLPPIQEAMSIKEINAHDWDIFLGHRRLSIIDTTPAGHQPMSDLSKNLWVSYNGEIYNFKEIRTELEQLGYQFYTQSDTEVIIYAYAKWGIECINKFNGMFALALYDNFAKKFFLIRDRYGIKPLYYQLDNENNLIFASENKAILAYCESNPQVDCEALLEYFTFQNIFTNKTFFTDIKLLEAGHYLEIDLRSKTLIKKCYWDFCFESCWNLKDEREYIVELERLFISAIKRQLQADVLVGGYLSGGIDSSSICGVASRFLPYLNTFSIGFDLTSARGIELGFDEREISEYLSYLFKTEHYEMVLKSGDMERCLRDFTYHLEEPRVGQSYPNFYAAKLASKFVGVVLSGCGGDELFGGYPWRYYRGIKNKDFKHYVEEYYLFWQRLVPNSQLKKLFAPIANKVNSVWTRDIFENILKGANVNPSCEEEYINNSLYFESKTFLHGLLMVEDKLSMAHSLEVRVPFLDNDLVDFAQKIPLSLKLSNFEDVKKIDENNLMQKRQNRFLQTKNNKMIFRKMASAFIPKEVVEGAKKGFSSPDGSWFSGESIDFVKQKLFCKDSLIFHYLDYKTCYNLINDHLEGKQNYRLLIWSLLNFNEWCQIHLGEYNA
ncbi:asparagine synthase (glutamine-hydrolyzing) [Helicobacter apodemus]|uniref:asparagine synthase (glutamine-hydrolyzing) n=1 Tax=Helicobacter apodemus TaxID=135569 RepID=A0A4U8UET8_9HELI|nr:asparagine synthase (glutamine-hydrolyzing) [Helicobacter apodemus]TLE16357.1 asparagine synthase (glutamine-hydrolyzing) [Helicobacter apodemus]